MIRDSHQTRLMIAKGRFMIINLFYVQPTINKCA